jgi:DNA-binding response OmpR family regulator
MPEKILIVDDDLETLRLIGVMLQRHGYEIAAATNGSQAVTMAGNEMPDLIVLDVMMPGMDGIEVTEVLRKNPNTHNIPILMFTAKSQVEDKVAGYDSGADDYLTKPVHPAELVAHIKSLLSRAHAADASAPVVKPGFLIGVIGVKGGLGTSTFSLNMAASLAANTRENVIAAEVRPGQGTWAYELGISTEKSLEALLKVPREELNRQKIEENLVFSNFGVHLLLATSRIEESDFQFNKENLVQVIKHLTNLAPFNIIDLGTPFLPAMHQLCNLCHQVIVLTDSTPTSAERTKIFVDNLQSTSTQLARKIDLILYNRSRSDSQLSAVQISEMLSGMPVKLMIPPAPELAYQAVQKQTPLINLQQDSLPSHQLNDYVKNLLAQIHK